MPKVGENTNFSVIYRDPILLFSAIETGIENKRKRERKRENCERENTI